MSDEALIFNAGVAVGSFVGIHVYLLVGYVWEMIRQRRRGR